MTPMIPRLQALSKEGEAGRNKIGLYTYWFALPMSVVQGYGQLLVQACIDEAGRLGLERVFALTYRPEFFERLGFAQADVMELPRKVWNECYRCPKFPGCNEIAMTLELPSPVTA